MGGRSGVSGLFERLQSRLARERDGVASVARGGVGGEGGDGYGYMKACGDD